MASLKRNPACFNNLVNSSTQQRTTYCTQKRKVIKHQVRKCRLNKEINSVSPNDESAESESEYPQVHEIIHNANDLAESSNA